MRMYLFVLICFIVLAPFVVSGQKQFVEGVATYKVTLEQVVDGKTQTYPGLYIITVKGKQIRKELSMENGYKNILIFNINTNTVYSLRSTPYKKYAIQLSLQDFISRSKKFEGFNINGSGEQVTIAGLKGEKGTVIYKDSSRSEIKYTADWVPAENFLFERFPYIKVFPLDYTFQNEDGTVLHLKAEKIEAIPVESASFRIPADYKIISNQEYNQLNR